ncbi:MAG TPA: hypothetical protein VEX18_16265, partial [Polyangiaceae bacterium]|nr:hypothetical protein [Polyangiaceae bacterium]
PPLRRVFALSPYAVLTGVYLAHYVTAGYGTNWVGPYRDVLSSPGATLLAFIESVPVWLATTATVPLAGFQLFVTGVRVPLLIFSLVVLAVLLPLIAARWKEQPPHAQMLGLGALLSLLPLSTILPQDRLRFFLAFGVYGLLGPWVVSDFDACERVRRVMARSVWRVHGFWLPLFFVPFLLSISTLAGSGAATALDAALPRAAAPTAILLNPPAWTVPWFQAGMRASRGEVRPPVFTLYAGAESLEIQRVDDHSLELHAPRSWFATPFSSIGGASFRVGARIALAPLTVELREVDAAGAPTRARFTFDRSLDDPGLTFWFWEGKQLARWTPPPAGSRVQLPAASVF